MTAVTRKNQPETELSLIRPLSIDETDMVCGANKSTFYMMDGDLYEVVHNDSGRALGVINHGPNHCDPNDRFCSEGPATASRRG